MDFETLSELRQWISYKSCDTLWMVVVCRVFFFFFFLFSETECRDWFESQAKHLQLMNSMRKYLKISIWFHWKFETAFVCECVVFAFSPSNTENKKRHFLMYSHSVNLVLTENRISNFKCRFIHLKTKNQYFIHKQNKRKSKVYFTFFRWRPIHNSILIVHSVNSCSYWDSRRKKYIYVDSIEFDLFDETNEKSKLFY